nr:helix-turn-helix domain-containing protein [Sphingopyxis sp. L1A2A]
MSFPTKSIGTDRSTTAPIAMRVPDACRFIGLGRSTLYVLVATGEIETVKVGAATLVLTESLCALIDRRRKTRV